MNAPENYADGADALRLDFIPRSDYTAPQVARLERDRLWPQVWHMACREEELPNVGDYVLFDILDESFLIVRSDECTINAFYNVCTHRGRRLRTERRGNLAGGVSCAYHAWRFDLEGQVRDIPHAEAWQGCSELDPRNLHLARPRVDFFAGWVWISMDADAPGLRDYLSPAAETLDAFEFENCRMIFHKTLHVPVDWKVVLEAFIEGYHTLGTHPQMLRYGDLAWGGEADQGLNTTHSIQIRAYPKEMDARERFSRMMIELNETLHGMILEPGVAAAKRVMELPEGSTEEEVFAGYWRFHREEIEKRGAKWPERLTPAHLHNTVWHLFPNSSVLPTVDGAFWYRMRPDPAVEGGCILDVWCLGRFAPGAEPKVEQEIFPDMASFKGQNFFLEQDFSNLLAVNAGMKSRAWRGAYLNPREEVTIYHFHRNLHAYLADPVEDAPATTFRAAGGR